MNEKKKRLPAKQCVLCQNPLAEIGGMRIVAQHSWEVGVTDQPRGGGNPQYPERSIPLEDGSGLFLWVKGDPSKWTDAAIERARRDYLDGVRPWLCQKCTDRVCGECGAPINYPMGSDVLYDNGCSMHIAVFPFDPGCSNKACRKYKEWNWTS